MPRSEEHRGGRWIVAQIYLGINYGAYEGWKLEPYGTPYAALQAVKDGETYGNEWKILRELDIKVEEQDTPE